MQKWILFCLVALALGTKARAQDYEQPGGPKHAVVDKTHQELRAYEGDRLVLQTNVSTGRKGRETPNGHYHVQGKSLMHYSHLYDNAPMPYSVQIAGNYFIHGFSSVPQHPASHGCIRVPLTGDNPAKQFYEWAYDGMPVQITGQWRLERAIPIAKPRSNLFFFRIL